MEHVRLVVSFQLSPFQQSPFQLCLIWVVSHLSCHLGYHLSLYSFGLSPFQLCPIWVHLGCNLLSCLHFTWRSSERERPYFQRISLYWKAWYTSTQQTSFAPHFKFNQILSNKSECNKPVANCSPCWQAQSTNGIASYELVELIFWTRDVLLCLSNTLWTVVPAAV